VVVAAVDEQEILPLLRELGHSPAVENGAGELIAAPPPRRVSRRPASPVPESSPMEIAEALLAQEHHHRVSQLATDRTSQRTGSANRPRTLARSLE
jgi:hypothetical protein